MDRKLRAGLAAACASLLLLVLVGDVPLGSSPTVRSSKFEVRSLDTEQRTMAVDIELASAEVPADPCWDYVDLEAGGGQADRQHAFNLLDARGYARWRMACVYGWDGDQFSCTDWIVQRESGWNHRAGTPSRAYGVPQSLPGRKMASHGSDWLTNPRVQTRWLLDYLRGRYGTPCAARAHWASHHWY